MDRRTFNTALPALLLAACGDTEMAEYTLQPSPIRTNTRQSFEFGVKGNWTPTVGGTADYTLPPVGTYVRILNLCFIHCWIWIANIGTGSTNFIWGLPFKSLATTNAGHNNTLSIVSSGQLASNVVDIVAYVTEDETAPTGVANDTAIGILIMAAADTTHAESPAMTDASILHISGFYEVGFGE